MAMVGLVIAVPSATAKSPAVCGPNDLVETGLQGQVPVVDRVDGRAAKGYNCNLDEVGHFQSTAFANFDTYKNCAYYSDTIGLYGAEGGTIVLDVSDPRHPVQTAYLTDGPTKNAGESLRVNLKRGLLVADRYTIGGLGPFSQKLDDESTARSLAVYDVKGDCRRPKLLANTIMPSAVGHEGCFQPDGMVYYMGSTDTITPIDLTDPTKPVQLSDPKDWGIHGCSTSDDGKRGYFADIGAGRLLIADTSQVQARVKGAQMRMISEYYLPENEGQQSTIPLTYKGKPYLFNWSEYRQQFVPCTPGSQKVSNFGYPAIFDISDETRPKVVSVLQTEVMKPENCPAVLADSVYAQSPENLTRGADVFPVLGSRVFLYDSHYCSTDRLHDPTIVACASFGSGMRVYDIRDPARPTEIAYWNAGFVQDPAGAGLYGNLAVARPVIRSDLGQIWFPDAYKGFHVLQFRDGVWPFAGQDPCPAQDYYLDQYDLGYADCRMARKDAVQLPSTRPCRSKRDFTIRLRNGVRARLTKVYVNGRLVKTVRGSRARIDLKGLPKRTYTVKVVAKLRSGRTITEVRRYRTCVPAAKTKKSMQRAVAAATTTTNQLVTQQVEAMIAYCRLLTRS